jgi:hypothetical protein
VEEQSLVREQEEMVYCDEEVVLGISYKPLKKPIYY